MASRPIKLPIVVTSDGTQAEAGFRKLANSLGGLERSLGKHLNQQAQRIVSMGASFFTVDALINGITKVLQHGQEVLDRATQFSAPAIEAKAKVEAQQLKQDVYTGGLLGPDVAKQQQAKLRNMQVQAQLDVSYGSLKNAFNDLFDFYYAQAGRLVAGDFAGFERSGKAKRDEILSFYTGADPDMNQLQERLAVAQAAAVVPVAGAPMTADQQQQQQIINALQEQIRELRQINTRLRGP